MFLQESHPAPSVHHFCAQPAESMNVLAYRSVAVTPPSDTEIQNLLRSAQSRNQASGLTGVLLYDRGTYFQWLEGPTRALAQVWQSISADARHHQIKVLRDEPISERLFQGWDLKVVAGQIGSVDAAVDAMGSSSTAFRSMVGKPKSIIDISWEDLFSTIVIPRLREAHPREVSPRIHQPSTAAIWHAEPGCGARLANTLISPRARESHRFINSLLNQGAHFNALYHEVFEPAQLHLGKLWEEDTCDDFHLSIALARLHVELRRVNSLLLTTQGCKPNYRVLLCTQPREPHCLGLVMSSEVFARRGWDVDCEFPSDNAALNELVGARWFDVLKVSQSGSLRRDSCLVALRTTIDAARSASMNPSLIVMVDGRTFVERPDMYLAVHANAMSASALNAASAAEQLLANTRALNTLRQVSVV